MTINPKKAVVLSSGGLDSTTVMAMAKHEGFAIYSLSFDYGQRHSFELHAARAIAAAFKAQKHLVMNLDLQKIGGSALTDKIEVPKDRTDDSLAQEIPATYVPARNTIFLAYALAWAEVLQSSDIFIGVNAVDYSGYPDCRPEYIESFERMAYISGGVINSLPSQKGQLAGTPTGFAETKSVGLFPLSVATITHRPMMGSFLNSDTHSSIYFFSNNPL